MIDHSAEWQQDGRRSQVLRAIRAAFEPPRQRGVDLGRIGEASVRDGRNRTPTVARTGQAGGSARPDDTRRITHAVVKARVSDLGDRAACIVVAYALHGCTVDADRLIRDRGHRGGREAFRGEYQMALARLCAWLPPDV